MSIPPSHEDRIMSLQCQIQCDAMDLERYREKQLYNGPIEVGMVFEWEPDLPWAAETIVITEVSGDRAACFGTRACQREIPYWNDISRIREAVVKSLLRYYVYPLPKGVNPYGNR